MPFPDPNNNNNIFKAPIPEINNGLAPKDKTPEFTTEKPQDIFDGAFSGLKPEGIITDTPFDTERYDKGESLILGENQNVLENVYAERQGFLTQLANGVIKTIPNAVGSFVGSFTAIPELLSGAEYGSTTGFADSWLKSWENRFPNYKTNYEQENPMKSWINPIYWGNKLGDGLIKNIGFTIGTIGGMIVQDAAIGLATEGIGAVPLATAQLGKLANSVGRLFATGEKLDKLVDVARTQKSMYDAVRNLSTGAKITSLAQYGLLSATAAMSEAGMEAYHVNEDTKKSLIDQVKAAKGEVTAEDMAEIDKLAKEAATTTYGWNMPVILASNAIMLGDFFSNKGVSDLTKEVLENTTLQGGKWSANMLSKGAKLQQYSKNFLTPFMTEGFWEEGNQTIISEYTKHRAESKFKGQTPKELTDFYLSQMLTPEYQESVLIGGLTGLTMAGSSAIYNKIKGNTFSDQQRKVLEGLNQNDSFTNNVKMFAEAVTNKGYKEIAPNTFAEKNEQILNMATNVANLKRTGRYEAFRDRLNALKEISTEELDKLGVTVEDVENIGQKLDTINELHTGISKLRNPIQNPTQAQRIVFETYKDSILQQTALFDSFKGRTETLRSELTDHFEFDILDALISKNNREALVNTLENKVEALKLQLEGFKALNPNSKEVVETKAKIDSLTKILSKSGVMYLDSTKNDVLKPLLENSPYFTKLIEANQEEFLNNVYEKLNDLKKLSINSTKLDKQDSLEFINNYAPEIESFLERDKPAETTTTESTVPESTPVTNTSETKPKESPKESPKETPKEVTPDSKISAFESMFGGTEETEISTPVTPSAPEELVTKSQKVYNKVVQKVLDKINSSITKKLVLSDDKEAYIEEGNPDVRYTRVSERKPGKFESNNNEAADRGTVVDSLLRAYVDGVRTEQEFIDFYNKVDKGEAKKFNESFLKDLFNIYKEFVASSNYELIADTKVLYGVLDGKQYAGTIDLLGIHKITGEVKIIDLKTSTRDRTDQTDNIYLDYKAGDTQQLNDYRNLLEQLSGIKASIAIFPIQVFSNYKGYNSAVKSDPDFTYELEILEDSTKLETVENEETVLMGGNIEAKKAALERQSGVKETTTLGTISNGDKIITVQTKPVTDEIINTDGESFLTTDNNPEGRIFINMAPLKDILVVPNNILTVIDKKTGKDVVNTELNSEGAVIFEAMQGRLFVVANINGQLVPFYKSSEGTSGKIQGAWYPFFGYTGAWLVKGRVDKTTGRMSYSPEIDRVTTLLNENLVFPDQYIDRVTNSIKNTKGEVIIDMNKAFKINRLWQKEFGSQTGTGTNYQIKGLKEDTRSESGLVALITGLNTTGLASSKTSKENSEWFELIRKNAESTTSEGEPVNEPTATPTDSRIADIERRKGFNGVEKIVFSNPNFSLEGFEIDGNYWNVVTSTDRAKVLVNINGVILPFYLTTGQAGKGLVPGWYPFFGIGRDGWLNKTDKSDMETYYERYWGKEISSIVKFISEELNSFYGTDPSVFKNDGDPNANSRPLTTLADKVEDFINSKLNYTPAINNADARKVLRNNIEQLGKEISNKYGVDVTMFPSDKVKLEDLETIPANESESRLEQPAAQNLDEPAEFNPTSEEELEGLAEEINEEDIAPEEDFWANRVAYLAVDKKAEPGEREVDSNYAANYDVIHSVKEGNELRFKLREGKTLEDLNGWVAYNKDTNEEYVTTDRNDPELVIDIFYKNTRLGAMPRNAKVDLSPQRFVEEQRNIDAQRTKVLSYLLDNKEVTTTVTNMKAPRLVTNRIHGVNREFFSDINIVSKETNVESIIHKGKAKPGYGSVFINIPVLEFGEEKELSVAIASTRFVDETLLNKLYESLFTPLKEGLQLEDFVFMSKGRGIDKKGNVLYLDKFNDTELATKIISVTKENDFIKTSGDLIGFDFDKLPAELKEVIRPYFISGMKGRYFNFNKKKKNNAAYQDYIIDNELLKTFLDPFKTGNITRWANHPDIHFSDPQVVEDIVENSKQFEDNTNNIEEDLPPALDPFETEERLNLPVITKTKLQTILESKFGVDYQDLNTFKDSMKYWIQKGMDWLEYNKEEKKYQKVAVEINSANDIKTHINSIIQFNEIQAKPRSNEQAELERTKVYENRNKVIKALVPFIDEFYAELSKIESASFEYEEDQDIANLSGTSEANVRSQFDENANFQESHYASLPEEIRLFLTTLPKVKSIENGNVIFYTNSLGFKQLINPYDVFDKILSTMSNIQIEKDLTADLKNTIIEELSKHPSLDLQYVGAYLKNNNITNEFWAKLLNVSQSYKANYVQAFVDKESGISVYSASKTQGIGNLTESLLSSYKIGLDFAVFNSRGELVELSPVKIKALVDDFNTLSTLSDKVLIDQFNKLNIFERLGLKHENPVIAKRIEDDFFVNKIKAGGNNQLLAVHFVKVFKSQLELLYENYSKYERSEDPVENDKTLNALLEEFSPFVSEPKVIKALAEIYYAHSNIQETGVLRSGGKNYYPYIKPSYKTRLMKAFSNIKGGLALQHRMFKDWGKDAIKGATLIARNVKNSLYLDKFSHEYTLGAVTAEEDSLPMKQLTDTDRLIIELATYIGNQTNPRLLHDTNEAKPIFELTQMFDGNYVINNLTAQNDVVNPSLDNLLLEEYIVKLYAENARIINTHDISKKALTDKTLAKLLMPGIHNTVSYNNDSMIVKEGNATRHIIFPFMSREMLDDMSKGGDLYAALRDFIYRKQVNKDNTLEEQYSELVWQPIDLVKYRNDKVFGEVTLEQGIKQLLQEDFRRDLDKNKQEFIAEGIFSGESFEPKVFERLFSKKSYGRKLIDAYIGNSSNVRNELVNIVDGKYSADTYEKSGGKTLEKAMKILSSYFLLEYTAYTRLHSLEMLMMTGDPGLFNKGNLNAYNKSLTEKENAITNYVKTYNAVSVELAKRNASLNASGMEGTIYWNDKQTTVIKAADFKVNSPLYETISTLIGKSAAKSYMSGDKTDAMKISTMKSVLEKEFIQGTLTENEFLNLFQQLAPEHYKRTVQNNPGYFKMFLGNYKENDVNKGLKKVLEYKHGKYLYTKAFNPIKNVGRGHSFNPKLNAIFEHYVKDADLPIARNTVGGQFNELIKYLEDNDIDSIVFDTAVKQYKSKPVELFVKKDFDGVEVEVLNIDALKDTITLPFDSFRQQLATPFEQSKSKVAESTQQIAILVADMPFDYPIGGNTKAFKEEYFKIHQDLFMDSLSSLSDDMGILFNYNQESGTLEMEFENLEKLSKYLIRQVKLQNLDDSLLDALQLNSDGKFKVPLTYTIGNKSLQPVILSEFTKHAVKKKIHGKPYFQATEGILQTIRTLEDFEYEKDGVNYSGADFKVSDATKASMKTTKEFAQGDGKLKGLRLVKDGIETNDQALIQKYKEALDTLENNDLLYSNEDTYPAIKAKRDAAIKFISEFEVRPMEIILGFNFLDENGFRLNLDDFLNEEGYIDESKIDPKLLEVNGFRIPYQGKSSGGWFKIVGFLPHHNADTAIVAAEIVAQMGSDFDIDKLYTYAYNYILVDGKLKIYNEENVAAYNKIQDDKKEKSLADYKDAKDLWEKYLVFDKNDHPATLATLELFEQVIENKYDFDTFDEIYNSVNTYSSLFKFLKEEGVLKSRKEYENKKGLQNNLLDLHSKVYLSPFYYRDIIRPLETPNSDEAIEFLEKAKKKNVTGYKVNNIYNRSTQRAILKDNVLGQTALGVFVTNSLIHTVFQETGAYFQYPLLIKKGGKVLRDSNGYKQTMFSDLTGDEEAMFVRENALKNGEIQYESLDGLRRIDRLFTLDGNVKVSTIYNEAIGISVDNPKDKKLAKLGINGENVNIFANLIRLLPEKYVVTLLNQPIMEKFDKKVESFNSMFYDEFQKDKVIEAARKILEDTIKEFKLDYVVSNENPIMFKFKQGADFVTPYIDLDALEKSIGGQITAENAENQIFLLAQMFLFREQSNNVRDMIGKMDTYRNGLKGTFVENKQVADKVEDLFVGTLVKNVSRNFNKTIPSITIKVPKAVNELFSNGIFAYGSFGYDYMYNTIGGQSKFRVDLGQEEFSHKLGTNELNQINNEFQRYLMTNPEITKRLLDFNGLQLISNLGSEYVYDETMDYATSVDDFLFNGKDSIYSLMKEVKAKGSNFDNMFALKLEVKSKKNNGIEIKSVNRDLYTRIKKDWLRLLSNSPESAEFKLAHKLLIYAFLYGNKQYGNTSLLRYMPSEVLESIGYGEIMNEINDKFNSAQSIHFINPFVESYIKNNPKILTKIPSKELKYSGQYVKIEDKRLEKKDYFYTVQYDKKTNRPYTVLFKRVDNKLFEKIDQLDYYRFGAVVEKSERMSSDKRYEQYFKVESYIPSNHTIKVEDLIKNVTSLRYEEDLYIKGMLESMRPALTRLPNYDEMTINFGKRSSYNPKTKTITVQHDQKISKVLVDIVHELSHALMEEEITKQESAEIKSQEYLDVVAAYSQFRKNIVNMRGQDDISKINFAAIEEALFKVISEKGTDSSLLDKFLNGTELDNSFSAELKKSVDVSLPAARLEVIKAELKARGITAELLNTLYYPYGDLHEFIARVFDGTLIPTLLDKEMVQSENAKGLFNRLMKSLGSLFTHLKRFFTSISGVSADKMKKYETSLAKEAVVSIFNFSKLVDANMFYDENMSMRDNYEAAYKKFFGNIINNVAKVKEEEIKTKTKENKVVTDTIYSKLGNKTESGNVVIKSVYQQKGIEYARSIGGVFSLRVNNYEKHFGNPFSSIQSEIEKGLIPTKSTKESVEKYIDWVVNSPDDRAEWIRNVLKSGTLKGKPIVYYKELGQPSHATALDYLINKYDWESESNITTNEIQSMGSFMNSLIDVDPIRDQKQVIPSPEAFKKLMCK